MKYLLDTNVFPCDGGSAAVILTQTNQSDGVCDSDRVEGGGGSWGTTDGSALRNSGTL